MQGILVHSQLLAEEAPSEGQRICVGEIVGLTATGQPLVEYSGSPATPLVARTAITTQRENLTELPVPVLLAFEDGDAALPIIVGLLRDTIIAPEPPARAVSQSGSRPEALVGGKKVVFEAREELVLRCGKGSITLRMDGKIVLKGTDIVSRASRGNRVQGASVRIN